MSRVGFAPTSVILGGVALSKSLQWNDRFQFSTARLSTKRTLGGTLVVFNQTVSDKGRIITLEATGNTGWFSHSMVVAIMAQSDVTGAQYSLDYHGELFVVMYNQEKPPAASFKPLNSYPNYSGDEWFTGTINLFTI